MRQHNRSFFFPTTTPPSPTTFFPSLPSPTLPTFPANLSSVLSSQSTHHHKPHFPKLLLFLSPFPPLLLLLVAIVFVFLFRKWTRPKTPNPSGTPREVAERDSPCQKLASPELRPLPPLVERVDGSSDLESGRLEREVSVRVGEECRSGSGRLPVESVKIGKVGPDTLPRAPHRSVVGGSSSVVEDCSGNLSNGPPPLAPTRSWVVGRSSFVEECGGENLSNGPPPWAPPRLRVGGGSSVVEDCGGKSLGFGPSPLPPPSSHFEYLSGRSSVMAVGRVPGLVALGLDEGKNVELLRNSDGMGMCGERTPRPKLKPLHWDKIRASSDRAMVWDQLRSSSFQLNEEMIEALFMSNAANPARNESGGTQVILSVDQENRVLDKKSQNIAHLLRALNVTKEAVCEALLEGNSDSLGTELLETLLKMAPSKDEEVKLKGYKDDSPFKLSPAKAFLKAVLDIPFAFKRVEAMLYISNFDSEVNYLTKSFETLEAACEELRGSRMFMKLLEAVLEIGNRMNVGVNRGDTHAFKLDALLKLVDVKGTDGKTTLLHFVVQEIIRAEGSKLSINQTLSNEKTQTCSLRDDIELKKLGLKVVASLSGDLSNVKKAAAMDVNVLSSNISKLSSGIGKIIDLLRVSNETRFHEAMTGFLRRSENEIIRIQAQESVTFSLVKEITEYFHGNSTRQEAHPFRIFIVARDFLSTLDQVCMEVGKINERSSMSCYRQFRVPVNPTLSPVFPEFSARLAAGNSEVDYSSSSS